MNMSTHIQKEVSTTNTATEIVGNNMLVVLAVHFLAMGAKNLARHVRLKGQVQCYD